MGSPVRLSAGRSGSRISHSPSMARLSDDHLFEAPPELVCPITQAVFSDPVLTQAGHAYERKAIEQYLQASGVDPLSREPLLNKSLIPVFSLKSRALEYREATARACLDLACAPAPPRPPVVYLRRAVELCSGDAAFLPQGLTPQVVSYVLSHPSNAYDRLALELFARGLAERGYLDRAAAVYFHLLSTDGEDRAAQAEMLRRCLACWQGEASGGALLPGPAAGGEGGAAKAGAFEAPELQLEACVFEKLVQMMDRGAPVGWLLDVSAEAGLGPRFAARLCEEILFPRGAPAAGAAGPDGAAGPPPLPWATEKEVLVKYTYVLTAALREEQERAERRIRALEGGGGAGRARRRHGGGDSGDGAERADVPEFLRVVQRVLRHPLVMLPCAAVAAAGDPRSPAVRAAIAVPFLALLRPPPPAREAEVQVNGKPPSAFFDE